MLLLKLLKTLVVDILIFFQSGINPFVHLVHKFFKSLFGFLNFFLHLLFLDQNFFTIGSELFYECPTLFAILLLHFCFEFTIINEQDQLIFSGGCWRNIQLQGFHLREGRYSVHHSWPLTCRILIEVILVEQCERAQDHEVHIVNEEKEPHSIVWLQKQYRVHW